MRRPWFESGPALAAAGFPINLTAHRAASPLERILRMAGMPDFAFAETLNGAAKPKAFADMGGLAAYIERHRNAQAIELVDVEDITLEGRDEFLTGVQVFTLLPDNGRDACLGYAWLKGQGRERLEPALRRARQDLGRRAAA